jgi:uncharacterized protein YcaQ
VQAAYAEPDAPPETAEALATQLRTMASWLGLADVRASERGNLAPALRTALRPATATASP